MTITAIPKEFITKNNYLVPNSDYIYIFSFYSLSRMKRPSRSSQNKGSDYYCETKIIVSFKTTIISLYSLFISILFSIILPLKHHFYLSSVKQHAHFYIQSLIHKNQCIAHTISNTNRRVPP